MRARLFEGSWPLAVVAAQLVVFSVGMTVLAEPPSDGIPVSGPPPGGGRPEGPPKAAFEACEDKYEGDECSVSLRDRTIDGHCVQALEAELFCMPDDLPPPPPAPPPGGSRAL